MLKYCLVFMLILESVSSAPLTQTYELIHATDDSTVMTGSVTLICRDQYDAEALDTNRVKFWLNSSSACDMDLRERVAVDQVGATSIKFNLTRNLEGNYSCGALEIQDNSRVIIKESNPLTMISLQTVVPVPSDSIQTDFTVTVDDTAVLKCPIQPGALLQSYSVKWMKDNLLIFTSDVYAQDQITNPDLRYHINDAFSLIIESIVVNDSSSRYQCVVTSTNPVTGVKQELQTYPDRDILLTLNVLGTTSTGSATFTGHTLQPEAPARCHHHLILLVTAGAFILAAVSTVLITFTVAYYCVKYFRRRSGGEGGGEN